MRDQNLADMPDVPYPLCLLSVPLAVVSACLQVKADQWFEPGMGPASGFSSCLPSGQRIFLEDFEYARQANCGGITVYAEAETLITLGIQALLEVVLHDLVLTEADVTWVQTEAGLEAARLELAYYKDRNTASKV